MSEPFLSGPRRPAPGITSHTFPAGDGLGFSYLEWEPQGEERARVIVLHGMGSAATEFAPLGEMLASRGIRLLAPNLRASGYDPEPKSRGHRFDRELYRRDFLAFRKHTGSEACPVPLFLYGESMGALLVATFLADPVLSRGISGGILASPVPELARPTPHLVRALLTGAAVLFPRFVIPPALFVHGKSEPLPLSRDNAYQEFVQVAPHRIEAFTIRFTAGISALMNETQLAAPRIHCPVLVMSAGQDVFSSPEQIRNWFATIASSDKTLREFPKAYHILLHDLDSVQVLETVSSWLDQHLER